MFIAFFFKLLYRHRVFGLDHLPKGAAIIAPNHLSYYDPPLAAISCPDQLSFLARKSLFKQPLFGTLIRLLNAFPVSETSGLSSLKTVCRLLKEQQKVLIFPEGGRSSDGELSEIKPGVVRLALLANVPIIPTFIHGTFDLWPPRRRLPKFFGKTACVFGTPIYPRQFRELKKEDAQTEISRALQQAIQELKKWYDLGHEGIPP